MKITNEEKLKRVIDSMIDVRACEVGNLGDFHAIYDEDKNVDVGKQFLEHDTGIHSFFDRITGKQIMSGTFKDLQQEQIKKYARCLVKKINDIERDSKENIFTSEDITERIKSLHDEGLLSHATKMSMIDDCIDQATGFR